MSLMHVVLLSDEIQKYKNGRYTQREHSNLYVEDKRTTSWQTWKEQRQNKYTKYDIQHKDWTTYCTQKTDGKANPTSHATTVVKELWITSSKCEGTNIDIKRFWQYSNATRLSV